MRYPDAPPPPSGTILFGGSIRGVQAIPGAYQVRLTVAGKSFTQPFEVKKDPRTATTAADFEKQFTLLTDIQARLTETHEAIGDIIAARADLKAAMARASQTPAGMAIAAMGQKLDAELGAVQDELVQMNIRNGNDVLSYPAKLNNLIAAVSPVVAATDAAPTAQSYAVFKELSDRLATQLTRLDQIMEKDVAAFNRLIEEQHVAAIPKRVRKR